MSISFEEISGEVVPDRRRERPREEERRPEAAEDELEQKVRVVMAREQRRLERLSDR